MALAKAAVLLIWVLCAASFFMAPTSAAVSWGRTLFWLMLVAHGAEFLFFQRVLRSAPGGLARNLAQTLVFGFFHIREVQGQGSPPASSP